MEQVQVRLTGSKSADSGQCFFRCCSFTVGSSSDKSGGPLPPPRALAVASSRSCKVKSLCFLGGENKEDIAQIAMPKPARARIISTKIPSLFLLELYTVGTGLSSTVFRKEALGEGTYELGGEGG